MRHERGGLDIPLPRGQIDGMIENAHQERIETKDDVSRVAVSRRWTPRLLGTIIRDPLMALPPEVYDHPVTVATVFGRQRVYVSDPELIQDALVRQGDALAKSPELIRILGPALGSGLLTANGSTWRWQRRSLAPAFQHDRLLALVPAMIAAAEATRDRWLSLQAGADSGQVDVAHEMMATTFKIIVDTMLSGPNGMDTRVIERCVVDYLKPTAWMFALSLVGAPDWTPYPGRRRGLDAAATMRRTVEAMVAARRAAPGAREDLVSLMLAARDPESGRAMSDDEIADNLVTFMTAGHETTAMALTWTLMLLAAHPAIADRVVAEIDAVCGEGAVVPDHVARLAYTRQVLNEAMRLYPPAPVISREVLRPIAVGGLAVAAKSTLIVPIYAVHRHRALWTDPERFDPDRFAPEPVKARHRYAFMPFGAGARICIGSAFATMEAVAVLAVLLKAARADMADPMPPSVMRITLHPSRPVSMRIGPRRRAGSTGPGTTTDSVPAAT